MLLDILASKTKSCLGTTPYKIMGERASKSIREEQRWYQMALFEASAVEACRTSMWKLFHKSASLILELNVECVQGIFKLCCKCACSFDCLWVQMLALFLFVFYCFDFEFELI